MSEKTLQVIFGKTGTIIEKVKINFTDAELRNSHLFQQRFLQDLMPKMTNAAAACFESLKIGDNTDWKEVLNEEEDERTTEEIITDMEDIACKVTTALFGAVRSAAIIADLKPKPRK